ncbi:COX15/CtaA family protein [Panacibacter sp. DH6]|uniref:COX15/CtaA family protein n=1 Tax=Panacibacter microcysteis TaxID=2793269 RepID=A0A931E4F7_9BACT|nr:COX15/CtaA family protein [Panacibacter microcysteis]MBG9375962.1 COX15/CtaA family protein [Panacibacter microcysteis]
MTEERSRRIIANWLFIGVGMLLVQVLLGGITRLTGSGLSITQWDPIMGAVPPTSEAAWQQAFDKYQQIAQYKFINNHFTLADFKFIFFWEWFHRLWARFMGLVFLFPFIFFLIKGWFKKWMIVPLVMLFVLGGLQGLLGWVMVKSGLNDENVYVNHFRLAIHFMAAMILIVYTLVFALSLRIPQNQRLYNKELKSFAGWITGLITIQLIYGCFMAGLKAASAAPTWPDINGAILPTGMFEKGFTGSVLHNPIAIHFIHRTIAYIIFILTIAWWFRALKHNTTATFIQARKWPMVLVILQVVLGIVTVVSSNNIVLGQFGTFEWLAELHQLTGMLLLLSFAAVLYILKPFSK